MDGREGWISNANMQAHSDAWSRIPVCILLLLRLPLCVYLRKARGLSLQRLNTLLYVSRCSICALPCLWYPELRFKLGRHPEFCQNNAKQYMSSFNI